MTISIRWLFAIVAIVCGLYVLIKSAGSNVALATGVGLIAAGVGLVSP